MDPQPAQTDKESESDSGVAKESSPVPFEVPFEVSDGGFVAWRTVAGAWLILFGTFGYAHTFGVYEDYYVRVYLTNHTPSSIAWIGSFQLMMPSLMGPVAGKIFDAGGFYAVEAVGGLIFTFSVFMLSLCKPNQYYQIFLAQAIGMGLGLGLTFLPSVGITVHHFKRRRGLASGIVMSGSAIGATVFPIMTNQLLPRYGFAKTIRLTGAIIPPVLVLGNLMMRTRLPPRSKRGANTAPPNIKSFFVEPAYIFTVIGNFVGLLGLFFPLVYIQLFSVQHSDSIDRNLVFYSVAILNASGALVRVLGTYLADLYGPFNVQVACSIGGGTLIWAMLGMSVSSLISSHPPCTSPYPTLGTSEFSLTALRHSGRSLVVISLLYGAFSNAYLALAFACVASLAKGPEEIGARTGVVLALSSFGELVSSPIQGALLTSDYHWIRPVAFAATMTFVSGACYFVARTLHARVTSTWLHARVTSTWRV
ncbi:MFS general substrate transporter [Mycena olivaceomarginata]|nr:MFS general substrate transporter [Mycena olivaceomarginata]